MPKWNDIRSNLDTALMEETPQQARLVFDKFKDHAGISIESAVDENFNGNKRMGYKQLSKFLSRIERINSYKYLEHKKYPAS